MPKRKPTNAGMMRMRPWSSHISIDGMISDHIEAATITPEAKPNKAFCNRAGISLRMKNTNPEPKTVPKSGIKRPNIVPVIFLPFLILSFLETITSVFSLASSLISALCPIASFLPNGQLSVQKR